MQVIDTTINTAISPTSNSQHQSRLSIVVPILNEARQLPGLLDHLQHWQHRGCEIIIVDGGSSDGSQALIEAHGFHVICAERGRARQMNVGAQGACGDILIFMHADTRLPQQADVLVRRALLDGQNLWGRFDIRLEGRHGMLPVIARMMNLRSRLTGIATGDQAIFVTAGAFNQIGSFADLPLMEDIQLTKDLCRISPPACISDKAITSGRRWMEKGVWRTIWLMWRLRWAYWRRTPAAILAKRYR